MGWLQDNTQGVIGGLKIAGGTALMFTPAAGAGAGLIGSGIADIGSEITGDIAAKEQDEKTKLMLAQKQKQEMLFKQQQLQKSNTLQTQGQQYSNPVFQLGGEMPMIEYQGNQHEQGGIQLPNGAEVEGGETSIDNYVFSNTLKPKGSKNTFAQLSKKIKKQYSLRENDSLDQEQMQRELTSLKAQQEALHISKGISIKGGIQDSQMPQINIPNGEYNWGGEMIENLKTNTDWGNVGMGALTSIPNISAGIANMQNIKDVVYDQVPMSSINSSQINPYLANNNQANRDINTAFSGANQALRQNAQGGNYLTNRIASGVAEANALSKSSANLAQQNTGIINNARQFNAEQAQQAASQSAQLATQINTTNTGIQMQQVQDTIGIRQNAINQISSGVNQGIQAYNAEERADEQMAIAGGPNYGYIKKDGGWLKRFSGENGTGFYTDPKTGKKIFLDGEDNEISENEWKQLNTNTSGIIGKVENVDTIPTIKNTIPITKNTIPTLATGKQSIFPSSNKGYDVNLTSQNDYDPNNPLQKNYNLSKMERLNSNELIKKLGDTVNQEEKNIIKQMWESGIPANVIQKYISDMMAFKQNKIGIKSK